MNTQQRVAAAVILAIILIILALTFCTPQARAHDAVSGWQYDNSCCGGLDCEMLVDNSVRESPAGWFIAATGETIPYADKRIRISGDEHFHRCRMKYAQPLSLTRCLYIPPSGY